MPKYLHYIIFFIFIDLCHFNISAQNERVKKYTVEKKSIADNPSISKEKISEKKSENIPEMRQQIILETNNKSVANIRVSDSVHDGIIKTKNDEELNNQKEVGNNKSDDAGFNKTNLNAFDDNVTYNKEVFQENGNSTTQEVKSAKLQPSVNYKPHYLREDTPKVIDNPIQSISDNKRVYLKQEAESLEIEISQNKNNPDYDLIQHQKKLDSIKSLLK